MKRMKVPDYKEKSVFGVPLIVHVQRCGFPLPLCLQQAFSHLRTHCLDQVTKQLLYKSGYKTSCSHRTANIFSHTWCTGDLLICPSVVDSGGTFPQIGSEIPDSGFEAAVRVVS